MVRLVSCSLVAFTLSALPASAQGTETYYPGTVWSSFGTLSPAEKGNVISLTHIEQGIAKKGFEIFGQGTFGFDTDKYGWNNRVLAGVGGRFTQSVGRGMVRGSISWVDERRFLSNSRVSGWVLAAETWFGWQNTPRPAKVPALHPLVAAE